MYPIGAPLILKAVEYITKLFAWLFVHPSAKLENGILDFMAEDPDWHSAEGV
jgi:hypothetical protein